MHYKMATERQSSVILIVFILHFSAFLPSSVSSQCVYPNSVVIMYHYPYQTNNWLFFNKTWNEMVVEQNRNSIQHYWVGLERLHELTRTGHYRLAVHLYTGSNVVANYENFTVGTAAQQYRLSVSGYSGSAGDALSAHNGLPFTTYDRDNSGSSDGNPAVIRQAAWWYRSEPDYCHASVAGSSRELYYWRPAVGTSLTLVQVLMQIHLMRTPGDSICEWTDGDIVQPTTAQSIPTSDVKLTVLSSSDALTSSKVSHAVMMAVAAIIVLMTSALLSRQVTIGVIYGR